MYEKIKKFYNMGLYTKEQVHKFAEKGVITENQYIEIVGIEVPIQYADESAMRSAT